MSDEDLVEARTRATALWESSGRGIAVASDDSNGDDAWRVEARSLLDRAQKLDAGVAAEDWEDLNDLTERLQRAINDRNEEEARGAIRELSDLLYYMEDV